MNCEDVPMSEWDKLTGAEQEALHEAHGAKYGEFIAAAFDKTNKDNPIA